MDFYFESIIDRLSLNEIKILNILTSSESTNRFSAKIRSELYEQSQLTISEFRKCMNRLEAANLIQIVSGGKNHLVFVNEYGQHAIQLIYERSNT